MLRVDSVEGLFGVRAPFACPVFGIQFPVPDFRAQFSPRGSAAVLAVFAPIFGYILMHILPPAYSRRCEFAHLCSEGVCPLFEVRAWLHF